MLKNKNEKKNSIRKKEKKLEQIKLTHQTRGLDYETEITS
jgi:hypothetical protein